MCLLVVPLVYLAQLSKNILEYIFILEPVEDDAYIFMYGHAQIYNQYQFLLNLYFHYVVNRFALKLRKVMNKRATLFLVDANGDNYQ